jgi:hypothetical protein
MVAVGGREVPTGPITPTGSQSEPAKYDYSSTQLNLPDPIAGALRSFARMLPPGAARCPTKSAAPACASRMTCVIKSATKRPSGKVGALPTRETLVSRSAYSSV